MGKRRVNRESVGSEKELLHATQVDEQMDSSYEEDARLSPIKSKKRKGRGSTTLPGFIKDESSGVQKIIHHNELGQPIGDVQYPSYLGVLARTMVPIVYKDWHKVPKELKEKLWSCVESAYNVDPSRKKKTLSSIGEKWRTFKKYLSKHIRQYKSNPKFLSKPPEIYPFIEQRHWNSFMRDRLTEKFQVQSNIQRERQSKSIYNHRLGRKGYARFQEELKQKTGSSENLDRSVLWKKARQNKKGEYDDVKIMQQVVKIDELTKQAMDGSLSTQGSTDILTMALGTVEHSGRVRGVGNFITPNSYFHIPRRGNHSICEEKLKSFESIVLQMQAQINAMAQQRPQTSQSDDANSNTLKSDNIGNAQLVPKSKESRLLFKNDMSSSNPKQNIRPPNPKKNIKPLVFKLNIRKSKPCKLVVGSLENIVAHGTMYERTGPQEVIHTVPLGKFNVRVSIDVAIVKDAPLPIPIPEEMTIVGEAIGCQVAWPKKFILVNNEGALKDVDCEKRLECIPAFASLVGNEGNSKNVDFEKNLESIHAFESLVEHFKYDEAINIPLEKDIFGEEISVQLQRVDMEYVCQMKELSITCIMLYISHFHQVLKASNLDRRFAFVNPYVVSGKCQTGGNSKSTLIARRLDDAKPDQLIFVPYNIGYHWVLLVIDLSSMIVYYLDSFYHGEINTSLKIVINIGLRIYGITKGMNRKPIWKVVECPQQLTSVECGFYIMRYMKDLIRDQSILSKTNFNGKKTYMESELDEVRVEWINFVLDNM